MAKGDVVKRPGAYEDPMVGILTELKKIAKALEQIARKTKTG